MNTELTTGARFHPTEIALSMLIKFATIAALGPPVVAVILFEVILNGMAMFNHANVRLPLGVDRVLRITDAFGNPSSLLHPSGRSAPGAIPVWTPRV